MPNEIRLRNLMYSESLYVNVIKTILKNNEVYATILYKKICIGKILIKSRYCLLHSLSDLALTEINECPLDLDGYFIINGSEKLLTAQKRMAANTVYVFRMKNGKYS